MSFNAAEFLQDLYAEPGAVTVAERFVPVKTSREAPAPKIDPRFCEQWAEEIMRAKAGEFKECESWSQECWRNWAVSVRAIINKESAGQPGRVISQEDLAWLETLTLEGAKVAA